MIGMRLFLAVDIPEENKKQISQFIRTVDQGTQAVKWVEQPNLHLTVKFLGEVPAQALKNISTAAAGSLQGMRKFDVSLKGIGFFPNQHNPRVIWVGITQGQESIMEVGKRLDEGLEDYGFDRERNRKAHLTIGRVRDNSNNKQMIINIDNNKEELPEISFRVEEVFLYQSELTSKGPIYTVLEKYLIV